MFFVRVLQGEYADTRKHFCGMRYGRASFEAGLSGRDRVTNVRR